MKKENGNQDSARKNAKVETSKMPLRMKRLGIIAGLGILLIFFGLIVIAVPVESECIFCNGEGKTDCLFCVDGTDDCLYCDGTGWDDCIWCEDGRDDCGMCVNGTCSSCGGTGGEWETCWSCDGSGVCDYCDGSGCILCDYSGVCSYCDGEGQDWDECWSCSGTGECSYCNGQGWSTCTFCNGEGRQVQVGVLLIPGGIMVLIGILLIPTALIVSKEENFRTENK